MSCLTAAQIYDNANVI